MYIFKIYGKEYKVRFTYRTICKGDVLDKFTEFSTSDADTPRDLINQLVTATAEALIAGLQKYHSDEFGYKDEKEHDALMDKLLDMFDDYEDESTEDHPQSAATLFADLQAELEKNGFLSLMMNRATEMTETAEKAEEIKTDMKDEAARIALVNTDPSENKS